MIPLFNFIILPLCSSIDLFASALKIQERNNEKKKNYYYKEKGKENKTIVSTNL